MGIIDESMQRATCANCTFWVAAADNIAPGYCHRNAPVAHPGVHSAVWPRSEADDWCGEHANG